MKETPESNLRSNCVGEEESKQVEGAFVAEEKQVKEVSLLRRPHCEPSVSPRRISWTALHVTTDQACFVFI